MYMNYKLIKNAEKYDRQHRRINSWKRLLVIMGCLVVFCTTYFLILPALTLGNEALCGIEEHQHDENCYMQHIQETELICTLPERETHVHSESCYSEAAAVVLPHEHTDGCYEMRRGSLICTSAEIEEHIHTEACYVEETVLACQIAEGEEHQHDASCQQMVKTLICQTEETSGHSHTDTCYAWEKVLACNVTEETVMTEPELLCQEEVIEHIHTESCYQTVEETVSSDSLICELEEHTHDLSCYSDPTADVESAAVWESTLPALTGVWADDVIAIAKSQLGYTESSRNYKVQEDGETVKGYSRYGDWYGDTYGDWCAMFVSFCLHYAEVEGIPLEANCQRWIDKLVPIEMYVSAHDYIPIPGDLIFFDKDCDGVSDHIGLVNAVTEDKVYTIEGNASNRVVEREYVLEDIVIKGYGILPVETTEESEISEKGKLVVTKTVDIYVDESYEVLAEDDTVITLTGMIPEDAQVKAYPVTVESEQQVFCAYDIVIVMADGSIFAPSEDVTVSIESPSIPIEQNGDTQAIEVYYVPDEGELERMDSMVTETGINFDTDHFSVYAVMAAEDSDSAAQIFEYTDENGVKFTLALTTTNYTAEDYDLSVELMNQDNYINALNTLTKQGQVIDEAFIYRISLKNKSTGQQFQNIGSPYSLSVEWPSGLFATVNASDILNFMYCKNSGSEPTALPNCELTYGESGNIIALTASDRLYPNSAEFMFIRSSAPNGLTAGQYNLKYNEVKDRFLKDSEFSAYYNANSPIGTAGSFHIVAFEEAHLTAHTNGNVLARDLYAGSNFGTNNLANELSYVQNYKSVHSTSASSMEHVLVIGSENKVEFADNGNAFAVNGTKIDKPKYLIQDKDTSNAPFIDLARVEMEVRQISSKLNNFTDANLTYTSSSELQASYCKLELKKASSVGVIHYTAAEVAKQLGNYVQIDGFKKGYNGTVVINVDCTGVTEINMPQARVVIDGEEQGVNEVTEFSAGKVIWNFINAEGVTINTHLKTGMVVAPGATVNINQNLNGTVVADIINVKAESHRTDFTGNVVEPDEDVEEKEYYITVQKIETGFAGTTLPGAQFDLYEWASSDGTTYDWVKVNSETLTTKDNGTMTLRNLKKSAAYKLVETKSPEGYILKDGAYCFWIRTDVNQKQPTHMPEGFSGSIVEVGGTLMAANDKAQELMDLSVYKVWKASDGTDLENITVQSITVNIYQIENDDKENKKLYTTLSITAKDNWMATLKNLPLSGTDTEGNVIRYSYIAQEELIKGYQSACEMKEGEIIITNTQKEVMEGDYILPETGGTGTHLYIAGGLLVMLTSGIFLMCKYKKRRKEDFASS